MTDTTWTEADFYIGRGENAEYLGTAHNLTSQPHPMLFQSLEPGPFTEQTYWAIAGALASTRSWPHPHADSSETEWTYCYDEGSVYAYFYGVEMLVIRCNTHRTVRRPDRTTQGDREWRPVNDFPTMRTLPPVTEETTR